MAEEQRPNPEMRRASPWSFILSIVIVGGIIALMATLIFGNLNRTDKLNYVQFVEALENNRVSTIYSTPKEETLVSIEGKYRTKDSATDRNYSVIIKWQTYYEKQEFEYTVDTDGTKKKTDPSFSIDNLITLKVEEGVIKTYNENDPYVVSWWDQWGPTLIMAGVSLLLVLFLMARLSKSVGGANNQALSFNKSRARRETNSKVRFSDVAGCDEEKLEMQEIVSYLKEPKKFTQYGAKLPKGVLLVGSPGTGKTLLAKAVAGEAGVPFYYISGSDFVEMFVGVGAGRVRDMFRIAKQTAPCLVFIDEIDAVGRQRGAGLGGGNDEREQTLNQLLVEMDGFSDNSGIVVIAATNRDDVLDPALLRAGRFDRTITVSLPDREGREAIFKVHARNKRISKEVDFAQLAKRTVGFSGADIENILNEAAILAVRNNKPEVDMDDIDEAIDRRVAGPAKKSKSLSKHEREVVAFHEAGHAIIGIKNPHSDKVQKITIIPRGNTGGHVRMTPEEDRFILSKKELEARIVGYLGGRSSEEIFFDDVSSGAQNDIEMATRIARMMVTELGMSSLGPIQYEANTGSVFLGRDYTSTQKNFSLATAEKIDAEITKIMENAHQEALSMIRQYKDEVTLIAHTLLEHEQITAEEIDYLLEHGHLKRDEAKLEEAKKDEAKEEVVEKPVKKPAMKKPAAKKPATTKKAPSKKASSKEEK